MKKGKSKPTKINKQPLRLLAMLAKHDITMGEAADAMGISINTANHQIAAARKAFGVRTTIAAIREAVKEGLIVW